MDTETEAVTMETMEIEIDTEAEWETNNEK